MRAAFFEYYGLSEKETDKLWKEGIIVFDTNILLSLYRLSKEAREEILRVMEGYKDRLWMPHQVGFEFHENRLETALKPIEAVSLLEKKAADFEKGIKDFYSGNPYIDYNKLEKALSSLKAKFANLASEWKASCPNPIKEDKVLDSLTGLFEGKVGDEYEEDKLSELFKIGADRYDKKTPPGYKDKDKPFDRQRYGDLIIWKQIIEYSKTANKDIIFVTDDVKEDWWALYKDDKLGPRKELIHEFRQETGDHLIWFYTAERFLSFAKEKKGASVKNKTIDEMKRPHLDWMSALGVDSELGDSNPLISFGTRFEPLSDSLDSFRTGLDSSIPASGLWTNVTSGGNNLLDAETLSKLSRMRPFSKWSDLAQSLEPLASLSSLGPGDNTPVGSVSGALSDELPNDERSLSQTEEKEDDKGEKDDKTKDDKKGE